MNSWITGGLEKLIQGDETPQKDEAAEGKKSLEAGPFAHYSAISSSTPSALPSPSPSFTNLHPASAVPPAGAATGYRPPPIHSSTLPAPIPPRAASAMEASKGRASPGVYKPNSAGPMSTSFPNRYQPPNNTVSESTAEQQEEPPKPLYTQWWSDGNDDGVTPTATSFNNATDMMGEAADPGSFVSLMDSEPAFMPIVPVSSSGNANRNHAAFEEDEEDLGFGNSKKKRNEDNEDAATTSEGSPSQSSTNSPIAVQAAAKAAAAAPAAQSTSEGKFNLAVRRLVRLTFFSSSRTGPQRLVRWMVWTSRLDPQTRRCEVGRTERLLLR